MRKVKKKYDPGLAAAFEHVSRRALGRHLGLSGAAIAKWDKVPDKYLFEVEDFTKVPREKLRPDLYIGMKRELTAA